MDDVEGLAELLHTAQVSVVAVAIDADGNVEVDLVVCVVRLALPDIERHAGASEHDTGEGEVERLGGRDNTDTL